ncbi:MAG: protein translocase subunit SecF [Candidatus Babeliales bacterium]|nr:protein translocase subunit SecF [Candidatus Babeliales bacterium]
MIDFLKYRYFCALFSLLILVAGISAYVYKGGFDYSVEFTGGTQVLMRFSEPIDSNKIKDVLKDKGFQGVDLREFSKNETLIKVQEFSSDAQGTGERIQSALNEALPNVKTEILQTDSVGPAAGATLKYDSIKAVLIALLAIMLYIGIRFKFAYAIGAIVALFHDAIVILVFFLLINREISIDVIAAIVAILGYSINDTIVIFNQIRENVKKMKTSSIEEVVNVSINQTLRRTILTSFSTSLVVLSLIIFGGEALRSLSLALMIGIIFGTYSSIYIASPVMLLFYKDEKNKIA